MSRTFRRNTKAAIRNHIGLPSDIDSWDLKRYGVSDPKMRLFRYGVQVNSLGLTEPQPENNIARIMIEMLAVTLSKNARISRSITQSLRQHRTRQAATARRHSAMSRS